MEIQIMKLQDMKKRDNARCKICTACTFDTCSGSTQWPRFIYLDLRQLNGNRFFIDPYTVKIFRGYRKLYKFCILRGLAFSCTAWSYSAVWSANFMWCIFRSCIFSAPYRTAVGYHILHKLMNREESIAGVGSSDAHWRMPSRLRAMLLLADDVITTSQECRHRCVCPRRPKSRWRRCENDIVWFLTRALIKKRIIMWHITLNCAMSLYKSINQSINHSVSQSVCLSVRPSVRPSIQPSIHPSIYLSIKIGGETLYHQT